LPPTNSTPNSPEPSDEDLARSFQQGCKEAGDLLFARHRSEFINFAQKIYRGHGDKGADDLVQEAYLTGFSKFDNFEPNNYRSWMYGIIRNIARTWIRAEGIRDKNLGTQSTREVIEESGETYDFANLLEVLGQKLTSLDARHHEIGAFMLEHFVRCHELPTVRQIEDATGVSHGTAERAREHVLEVWKGPCKKGGFWPLG